jgi:hypothetical protein
LDFRREYKFAVFHRIKKRLDAYSVPRAKYFAAVFFTDGERKRPVKFFDGIFAPFGISVFGDFNVCFVFEIISEEFEFFYQFVFII